MTPDRLYVYRHDRCNVILHANARAIEGQPFHCRVCGAPMRFLYDYPVRTERDRIRWIRGAWWGEALPDEPRPARTRRCAECPNRVPMKGDPCCSDACREKFAARLKKIEDAVEEMYIKEPWLRSEHQR